jgi:hypothetical protein
MENLPTNLCFEREGTTNQEGVPITIDLWSIFNEFPSLNFATVYVKVDYVIFPHAENTFWFYIESPHVIAPDKKPYTLAAAKKQAPEVVVLTNTAATGDSRIRILIFYWPTHINRGRRPYRIVSRHNTRKLALGCEPDHRWFPCHVRRSERSSIDRRQWPGQRRLRPL